MGTCISRFREDSKLDEAAAESAILRERVRELEMQSHSWEQERKEHLARMRSVSDFEDASTLIQSPATALTKSPTLPRSTDQTTTDPTNMLLEMEGQLEFLEGQRKLQKDMESKGLLSRQQSQRMTQRWKDDSVHLMERVLAAEQSNRTLSEELAAARSTAAQQVSLAKESVAQELSQFQTNEHAFAKRLEIVTDELTSTEAALAVCLALLKADPRRNNAVHCKDAAKHMEPFRFYSRIRARENINKTLPRRPDE